MNKKIIGLAAPFTSYSGYGQYARSIAMMLIQGYSEQCELMLFDLGRQQALYGQYIELSNTRYTKLQEFITPIQKLNNGVFDIFISVTVPMAFIQKGLINIGVTALAETDKIHPQLIQHCNRMQYIFVMSDYNIDSLKKSSYRLPDNREIKLQVPVSKLEPLFVPIGQHNNTDISDFIDSIPQQFLYLSVGEWLPGSIGNDRKDIGALISTFIRTFGNNEEVGLVLKVNQGRSSLLSQYVIRQKMLQICRGLGYQMTVPNIYIISGNLSEQQIYQLYLHNKIKTMVSFSHGQSYGIPMMQFSAMTAKPILAPYHTGMIEYIKPEYSEVLISRESPIHQELLQTFYKDFMIPESRWYTIDYQYAAYKLAQGVKNYNSLCQRAIKQSQYIKEKLSIENVSKSLYSVLNNYINSQMFEK